jgi:hypothetical protein
VGYETYERRSIEPEASKNGGIGTTGVEDVKIIVADMTIKQI